MALGPVGDDGVSVRFGNTLRKELLELAAVFFGTAIDGGRRRLRLDAVAVIGCISIAESGSETNALGCDILLLAVLPAKVENTFHGQKVTWFVVVSSCIFDVMEGELVLIASCNGCAVSVPAH